MRSGISAFAGLSPALLDEGIGRLAADIGSGKWRREHRDLMELAELDLGYRLIVA